MRVFKIEYSAQLINRGQCAVKDNRTAYELRKCRPQNGKLPQFAEAVMYLRVAEKGARQKFEDRWNTCIYQGLVERSIMFAVGTPSGVVKVNCIKRFPMNQAKDPELLKSIRGYPWRPSHGDVQNEPGEVPIMVASGLVVPEHELPPHMPDGREAEGVSRRVHTRRNVELRKNGFTQGCRGCMARPFPRPRIIQRRASSGLNPPWRRMMLNERGSLSIDKRERRLEPPDNLAVLRTSRSVDDGADAGGGAGSTPVQ